MTGAECRSCGVALGPDDDRWCPKCAYRRVQRRLGNKAKHVKDLAKAGRSSRYTWLADDGKRYTVHFDPAVGVPEAWQHVIPADAERID